MPVTASDTCDHALPMDRRVLSALIENLYCELLVLVDETRAEPIGAGVSLAPQHRVHHAAASLHLSARLMQMLHWVVEARDAVRAGTSLPDSARVPLGTLPHGGDVSPSLRQYAGTATRLAQRIHDLMSPPSGPIGASVPQQQLRRLQHHFAMNAA